MNKQDLIEAVALELDGSKTAATNAVNAVLTSIEKALGSGESVQVVGFGTFAVKTRAGRTGRNPATGASLEIPAKNVVKFSAGSRLNDAVA